LIEIGFVDASDITVEAAHCKLMSIFGNPGISLEEAQDRFQINQAGEQSSSTFLYRFTEASIDGNSGVITTGRAKIGRRPVGRLERVVFRLIGVQYTGDDQESNSEIQFILRWGTERRRSDESIGLVRTRRNETTVLLLDATESLRHVVNDEDDLSFELEPTGAVRIADTARVEMAVIAEG
jgi:hypothetical protein